MIKFTFPLLYLRKYSPFPTSLPTQLCVYICFSPNILGCMAFPWNKVYLLGATHLREDLSFLSVQHLTAVNSSVAGVEHQAHFPLHVVIWSVSGLCGSCVCGYNHCKSICAALCCVRKPLSLHPSTITGSYTLSVPSSTRIPESLKGVCNACVPLRARDSAAVS